jgi:MoxR-like ATPase
MSVGMSCRWATGADEAADDYVGFVSRRLDVVAGERDGLRAAIVQALADLDAYDRSDGRQATAPLSARAVLRRALGVT